MTSKLIFLTYLLIFSLAGCANFFQPAPADPNTIGHQQEDEEIERYEQQCNQASLDLARQSFMAGCVEALKSRGEAGVIMECREKARVHERRIRPIIFHPNP